MLTLKMQGLLWALVLIITFISVEKNTYKALYNTPARQIGVLACALVFAMLWQIKAGILSGLDLHILGVTAATLILGWRLAILSSLLASALLAAFANIDLNLLPMQILFGAFIPTLLSYLGFIMSYQYLPRHFFVYIFVNIGMVSGLLPVVGVPLPLISYGGTSMVTLMAGFGIIMSIATDKRMLLK